MTWFRDFSAPLWELFGGNLLLFATLLLYIAWWTVSFGPNGDSTAAGAGIFITLALFVGVAAVGVLALGLSSFPQTGKGFPFSYILPGAIVLFIILLAVTQIIFQRVVTSELLLIVVWAALEFSMIAVLQSGDRFSLGQALTIATLVVVAMGVGLVCYVQHYGLDEISRFWNGLIPLIVDAGVVAVFLIVLALS